MRCNICGAESNGSFCNQCGSSFRGKDEMSTTEQKQSNIICNTCGAESSSPFCPQCGNSLTNQVYTNMTTQPNNNQWNTAYSYSTPDEEQCRSSRKVRGRGNSSNEAGVKIVTAIVIALVMLITVLTVGIVVTMSDSNTDESAVGQSSEISYSAEESIGIKPPKENVSKKEKVGRGSYGEIEYKELARYPDKYRGEKIKVLVKIDQTLQDGNTTYYRGLSYSGYNMWFGDEYVIVDKRKGGDRVLDGDILEIYGEYSGLTPMVRALTDLVEDVVTLEMKDAEILDEETAEGLQESKESEQLSESIEVTKDLVLEKGEYFNSGRLTIKNNGSYIESKILYIDLFDADGVKFYNTIESLDALDTGESVEIELYIPDDTDIDRYSYYKLR